MKLRLVFNTMTKNGKEVILKLNIAPSKHLGFINFVNLALNQNKNVTLVFEKIDDSGKIEEVDIEGKFEFKKRER